MSPINTIYTACEQGLSLFSLLITISHSVICDILGVQYIISNQIIGKIPNTNSQLPSEKEKEKKLSQQIILCKGQRGKKEH